jgi:hypothetical protein
MGRGLAPGVAALAAFCLGAVACSSDSSARMQTGLQHAMASIPAGPAARSYLEYGSPAALRELGVLHPAALQHNGKLADPRWYGVIGVGAQSLANQAFRLPTVLGLNVFAANSDVSIGQPPNAAIRIDGAIDASAVTAKLRGLGAEPRRFGGARGLSFGPDNSVDVKSKIAQELSMVNQLDQVSVTDEHFAASPNGASLQQVIGDPDPSLLDTAPYGQMADCLGDVLAAVITTDGDSRVSMIGVGVRTPASATATRHEIVCVQPRAGATSAVLSAIRKNAAPDATDPTTNAPMSTYVVHTAVTSDAPFVQADLTMKPATPPGFVIQLLYKRAVQFWDRTCTPRQPALAHTC